MGVQYKRTKQWEKNSQARKRLTSTLICVYRGSGLEMHGEILNMYLEKPVPFRNGMELIVKLDDLFERAGSLAGLEQLPAQDGSWRMRKQDPVQAFGCIDVMEKNNEDFCGMIRWRQTNWKHRRFRNAQELLEIIQDRDDMQGGEKL